ncbi:MAG: hypothetical protein U9N35_06230 [Euryarchaeota archaeon]|nr:hypothetical protein [Euryarchaeota archaeon]
MAVIKRESGTKKEFLLRINDLLAVYTVQNLDDINRLKRDIPHKIEKKKLENEKKLRSEKKKIKEEYCFFKKGNHKRRRTGCKSSKSHYKRNRKIN